MKLYYPLIDTTINFSDNGVPALVIESQASFLDFLQDVQSQIDGCNGKVVFSVQDKPADMGKYVEMITTFIPFTLNRKTLINRIISCLEKKASDAEHFLSTHKLLMDVEMFVADLTSDLPCDIITDKICIGPLLKAAGIEVRDDYENLAEKVLDYMELVREFDRDRLFILVNSRCYFEPATLEAFLQTVLSHDYKVLLVDHHADEHLCSERRITLDRDLCVF